MKLGTLTGTSVLLLGFVLTFGFAAPSYGQDQQEDRPKQQESGKPQDAKPEHEGKPKQQAEPPKTPNEQPRPDKEKEAKPPKQQPQAEQPKTEKQSKQAEKQNEQQQKEQEKAQKEQQKQYGQQRGYSRNKARTNRDTQEVGESPMTVSTRTSAVNTTSTWAIRRLSKASRTSSTVAIPSSSCRRGQATGVTTMTCTSWTTAAFITSATSRTLVYSLSSM